MSVQTAPRYAMTGPSQAVYLLSQEAADRFIAALTVVKAAPSYVVLRGENGDTYTLTSSSEPPFAGMDVRQPARRSRSAREVTMAHRREAALEARDTATTL